LERAKDKKTVDEEKLRSPHSKSELAPAKGNRKLSREERRSMRRSTVGERGCAVTEKYMVLQRLSQRVELPGGKRRYIFL